VIVISSVVAGEGMGNNGLYTTSEAAIRNVARGWIVDLKARKIRVNVISPGNRFAGLRGAGRLHDSIHFRSIRDTSSLGPPGFAGRVCPHGPCFL
jgi:NAD(P)-dependent dehydrogenase (short-subunit alcohol dehydrogenase family)